MPARTKRAAFAAENIRYLAVGVKNLGFGGGEKPELLLQAL